MSIVLQNQTVKLSDIIREYRNKKIRMPDWQRKLIWKENKREKWIDDIKKGGQLPGVIITFRTKESDDDKVRYLNDGAQRILTTLEFVKKLEEEHNYQTICDLYLDAVSLVEQFIEYNSYDEAFKDFFRINQGTICTPYELGQGILSTKLDDFNSIWKVRLEKLNTVGTSVICRMRCKRSKSCSRESTHKYNRDDYALFERFVTKEKDPTNMKAGQSCIPYINDPELEDIIEYRLYKVLLKIGLEGYDKHLSLFNEFINDQLALYEHFWNKLVTEKAIAPTICNIRWYLCVAIYRRNNDIQHEKFVEFLEKYISSTMGGSGFIPKGGRDRITIGLSNLNKLASFCKHLPIEDFNKPVRRKRNRSTIADGYDISHKKSFLNHGENDDIFLEPHSMNVSRGSKDIFDS